MKAKIIFLLIPIMLLSACFIAPSDEAVEPMSMTFMAGYRPQANLPFVGVYVAKEKGFFEDEGLDVTVEHSPGHGEHLQLLTAGKAQVTTQDAGVLLQRRADPGLPLVSIALIGQRGQQAFAALPSSGMKTPKDWEGHTVGYKGTPPPELNLLLQAAGADPDKIELTNVGFDPRVLSEGKVDVYPIFNSNEPYLLRQWGYDLTIWHPADYDVPSLGLAYVTTDQILEENPELLARFLRAALKGIDYAAAHPDEAVEIVLEYAGDQADPDHMRFMLDTELADAQSELTQQYGIGWQTHAQWRELAEMISDAGLPAPADVDQAFTTQILEAAH